MGGVFQLGVHQREVNLVNRAATAIWSGVSVALHWLFVVEELNGAHK